MRSFFGGDSLNNRQSGEESGLEVWLGQVEIERLGLHKDSMKKRVGKDFEVCKISASSLQAQRRSLKS